MIGVFARGLLMAGGVIASWFVAHDALNYEILKFVAAMLIFMLIAALAAFWPAIWGWVRGCRGRIGRRIGGK